MFKFFVLGVFFSQTVVKGCYGQTQSSASDSQLDITLQLTSPPKNDSSDALILPKAGPYHIYASRLNLYLGGSVKNLNGDASNVVSRELDADYFVSKGEDAHKLHSRKLSWGQARRICVDEGGHLAVIRKDVEEKILLGMMARNSVTRAWVGYHDITEKNDWFSVLDEPLGKIGWARWSKNWTPNPDMNRGRCAELIDDGGLANISCDEERSFICKVSVD